MRPNSCSATPTDLWARRSNKKGMPGTSLGDIALQESNQQGGNLSFSVFTWRGRARLPVIPCLQLQVVWSTTSAAAASPPSHPFTTLYPGAPSRSDGIVTSTRMPFDLDFSMRRALSALAQFVRAGARESSGEVPAESSRRQPPRRSSPALPEAPLPSTFPSPSPSALTGRATWVTGRGRQEGLPGLKEGADDHIVELSALFFT